MNKIISATIGGILFQIDEQAYENLDSYLRSVKLHFRNTAGSGEIVADIEARIAEMLSQRLKDTKMHVTAEDVREIINRMGRPEDFDTYDEGSNEPANQSTGSYESKNSYRRIFRDDENRVIGGVCSGIAAYLDIDPIWLRLGFAFAFFVFGSGFLLYLILWAILPKARTIPDRLEMRGEPVNISNIKKNIKDELTGLEERFEGYQEDFRKSDVMGKMRKSVSGVMPEVKWVIKQIIHVLVKLIGILMVFIGLSFLVVLSLGYAGFFENVIQVPFKGIFPFLFHEPYMNTILIISLVVVVIVPLVWLILQGFLMLFNIRVFPREIKRSLKILWTAGFIVGAVMIGFLLNEFSATGNSRDKVIVNGSPEQTLFIELIGANDEYQDSEGDEIRFFGRHSRAYPDSNGLYLENVRLDIVPAKGDQAELLTIMTASGGNYTEAMQNAQAILYNYRIGDSVLQLDPTSFLPPGISWRNQQVRMLLKVPAGRKVMLGKGVGSILYDVDNEEEVFDAEMEGHLWVMRDAGLKCLDCRERTGESNYKNQKDYFYTNFTEIESRGNLRLVIEQGSEFRVLVAGEKDRSDRVEFELSGKRLLVKSSHLWLNFEGEDEAPQIIITLPKLEALHMRDRADAQLTGIKTDELVIEAAGYCQIKAELEVDMLDVEMAGAGNIQLKGHARELKVEIAGAGELNAGGFETEKVDIELNGAARAKVNASQMIKAELNGASRLTYKGSAQVSSSATGASVIEKE